MRARWKEQRSARCTHLCICEGLTAVRVVDRQQPRPEHAHDARDQAVVEARYPQRESENLDVWLLRPAADRAVRAVTSSCVSSSSRMCC